MRFVLRMAVRETRASWRRLLFFFVCIAVGVAAIVALRSVIQSVRDVLRRARRRRSIAADVLIIDQPRLDADAAAATIDRRLAEAGAIARTETIETPTMVRPADESTAVARMVELSAVQRDVPALRHASTLEGGQPYSHALLQNHGVLVRPELLTALGVKVGDRIVIGQATFTIRGVDRERAGRRHRRLQPRPARAHRLRRPAVDRAARLRQPRAPRAARHACRRTASSRWSTTLRARSPRASSSTRGRTARPRIRSAATSSAPRTT